MDDRLPIPFEQVVEGLSEGVLVNAPDGRIIYVNAALGRILAREPASMIGKRIFDFMDDEGRAISRQKLRERAAGVEDRFDFRWVRPDGTSVWTQVATKPAFAADGTHLGSLVAITDISTHKALQDQLEAARSELEQRVQERTQQLEEAVGSLEREVRIRRFAEQRAIAANTAKTGFLANMSHELRTPLNAIIGYAELALEEPDLTVGEVASDLERIERSGRHLLALIDDLLDLSRIEKGSLELEVTSFDPSELFGELVDWVRPDVHRNGNFLSATIELPELAWGDPRRIRQIVLNLLSNANKFCRGGRLELRAEQSDGTLLVHVSDEGPGIDPAEHERIFRPFERDTTVVEGTGLGLAISREYARRMGGDLTVASAVGRGAIFTLTLPQGDPT